MTTKTKAQPVEMLASEALIKLLPGVSSVREVGESDRASLVGSETVAITASFVGATSADVALFIGEPEQIAVASGVQLPAVSVIDVVRPALEAATGVLGTGVLGDVREANAASLTADPAAVVFALLSGDTTTGWFAIKLRTDLPVSSATQSSKSVIGKLNRISNVEMALTVEIGRTRMSVRDVLALEPGAVVELDRSAGAPADVLLNGRLIAHGEVVVVDQDYAVRITKILDVAEGFN